MVYYLFILHYSLHNKALVLPPPLLTDSPFDPLEKNSITNGM